MRAAGPEALLFCVELDFEMLHKNSVKLFCQFTCMQQAPRPYYFVECFLSQIIENDA